MNTMTWLVRREFWENRAIWTIPVGIGGFMLLAALFGMLIVSDTAEAFRGSAARVRAPRAGKRGG